MIIMKFGGTSVGDADAVGRVCRIVGHETRPRIVVVSALSGVTDQLLELAAAAGGGDDSRLPRMVDCVRERHTALAAAVVDTGRRQPLLDDIATTCRELGALVHAVAVLHELSPRSADAIAAFGETLSARLVAAALASAGVEAVPIDPTDVLITDSQHGCAQPLMTPTTRRLDDVVRPLTDAACVPVIGGYVGVSTDGVTTTLGRGGSDYSAAIFGAALGAAEIQIWTDVDGMLTADPRVVTGARLVPHLSYGEASELAYFGAKVLHPATIQPAVERQIPVRILNARHPDRPGTAITAVTADRATPVTALACKRGLTVIEIASARMLMAHGFLRRVFEIFDRFETPVDVVTTSEVNVSVTIDDPSRLDGLVGELSSFAEVTTEPDIALLCVIGDGLHDDVGLFPRVVAALDGIACRMVSQSASRRNLTFVLQERELDTAMTCLHDHFFNTPAAGAD